MYTKISLRELVNGSVLSMLPIYINALERTTVFCKNMAERRLKPCEFPKDIFLILLVHFFRLSPLVLGMKTNERTICHF